MKDFAAQALKSAVKQVLRQRKIRYEELATQLDCSVPTIKRVLGNEELTLSRLLEICEVLELSLGELEVLAKKEPPTTEEYTEAQSTFLARNPAHFAYLMKLYDDMSPAQIAQKYGLSARSTDKYLVALERQELIHVTGAQRVKPAYKRVPNLGKGELAQRYYQGFIQKGADLFKQRIGESIAGRKESDAPESFLIHGVKISPESYTSWAREQERLLADLLRIASFEEKTRPAAQLMTAVVMDARTLVKNDSPILAILDEMLGKIEAI